MALIAGTAADASVPTLGASGAIAAVLGAYWVLYPGGPILTIVAVFPLRIPAWVFLGLSFVYQLVEANRGLLSAGGEHGGTRSRPTSAASSSGRSSPSRSSAQRRRHAALRRTSAFRSSSAANTSGGHARGKSHSQPDRSLVWKTSSIPGV